MTTATAPCFSITTARRPSAGKICSNNRQASYANLANVNLETTGVRVEILSPTAAYISCKWKQTGEYKGELESSTGRMTLSFQENRQGLENRSPAYFAGCRAG